MVPDAIGVDDQPDVGVRVGDASGRSAERDRIADGGAFARVRRARVTAGPGIAPPPDRSARVGWAGLQLATPGCGLLRGRRRPGGCRLRRRGLGGLRPLLEKIDRDRRDLLVAGGDRRLVRMGQQAEEPDQRRHGGQRRVKHERQQQKFPEAPAGGRVPLATPLRPESHGHKIVRSRLAGEHALCRLAHRSHQPDAMTGILRGLSHPSLSTGPGTGCSGSTADVAAAEKWFSGGRCG